MTLGNKIYQNRKAKGFSQEELATQINVSRQTIYKWENDQAMPDLTNLRKLSAIFQISIEELLDESDTTQTKNENDIVEKALNSTGRVMKKHWRKGGYFIIYWGVGFTLFSLISMLMISGFNQTRTESDFMGLNTVFPQNNNMFSFFDIIPKIALVVGILLIVVGGFLAFKDYQLNHKK